MIIKLFILLFTLLVLTSCSREDDVPPVTPVVYEVKLYALAPVLLAVVVDKNGQIAVQKNLSTNIYTFTTKPELPLSATTNEKTTFIDTDFDGKRSAFDLVYDEELHSNSIQAITHLNDALLHAADLNSTNEFNTTKYASALVDMQTRFSLSADDIEHQTPRTASSKNVGILSDTLTFEKENLRFDPTKLETLAEPYKLISDFYTQFLSTKSIVNAVKYNESLSALALIDQKLVTRAIENEKPRIPDYLNSEYLDAIENIPSTALLSSEYNNKDLAYFALSLDTINNLAYIAAGNDGLDTVDTSSATSRLSNDYNGSTKVFATELDYVDKSDNRCIFVASMQNQVEIYGVDPLSDVNDINVSKIIGSYKSLELNASVYDVQYFKTNTDSLEYLLVANGIAGLEIVDIQDIECNVSNTLTSTSRYNSSNIGTDSRSVLTSSNGVKVYSADGANGIYIVDIKGSSPVVSGPVVLENNESAYDLYRIPNHNELYISTDNGIQIYNTSDDSSSVVSKGRYQTEGAHFSTNTEIIKVEGSKNNKALFIADLSGGIKILDISYSQNPQLCGVAYFAGANVLEQTTVRDLKLDEQSNGSKSLYIANDSNGLIKIEDAKSVLFEHCKTLLD